MFYLFLCKGKEYFRDIENLLTDILYVSTFKHRHTHDTRKQKSKVKDEKSNNIVGV